MPINHTFYEAMMGLGGQGHVSDNNDVWITHTHFPLELAGNEHHFSAEKAFCIVRNPLDVIASFAHFTCMSSHSLTPKESLNEQFTDWWVEWTKSIAD